MHFRKHLEVIVSPALILVYLLVAFSVFVVLAGVAYPANITLSTANSQVSLNTPFTLTVGLDEEAPVGGSIVNIFLTPADSGTCPADVLIPEGANSTDFTCLAGSSPATVQVSAYLGALSASITVTITGNSILSGDVNGDQAVGLDDAILALKILAGDPQSANANADINGDNKVGLAEVSYILKQLSSSADDSDFDGIPTFRDNCPDIFNRSQADMDADGKGDLCDLCPAYPNPGSLPCAVSIYAVKKPKGPSFVNQAVQLEGVVTAVKDKSFFLQVPENEQDPDLGFTFSGIFVFNAVTYTPVRGHRVRVTGTVADYFSQLQLSQITNVMVTGTGNAVPTPVVVIPSQIAGDNALARSYEGVLIQVVDALVTAVAPATNEFTLAGLRVNDFIHQNSPLPAVGSRCTVTGVLRIDPLDSYYKLEPREAADVACLAP